MRRTLIALLLLASPLLAQAPNGWTPIENGWAEIQVTAPTGTVTTTGTLASGQVALGSGATSITGDAGATHAGTAGTMKFTIGGITFGGSAAGGTGLYLSAANTLGFTTDGTERWVMNASGALNPTIDATYDIGTSLVRPRDLTVSRTGTFGTSVVTPVVSGGADSATPNATAINGANSRGGTDTNVAGGNLTIRPGAGTGSATGSSLIFQTPTATGSGTTAQTQTTRLTINEGSSTFTRNGAATVVVENTLNTSYSTIAVTNDATHQGALVMRGSTAAGTFLGVANADTAQFYSVSAPILFGSLTANDVVFGSNDAEQLRLVSGGPVVANVPVRLKGYTVATLPAGTVGDTAYCTDLTAPTFMAVAVGGGAVVGKVFYDGTNWITQ